MKLLLTLLLLGNTTYAHKSYEGKLNRVIDGDTIVVTLELGFDIKVRRIVRLFGVDAPETRTLDRAEKRNGLRVKRFVTNYLEDAPFVRVVDKGKGKFGRTLGVVYKGKSTTSLNQLVKNWSKDE